MSKLSELILLTKNQLLEICSTNSIDCKQSWNKTKIATEIRNHFGGSSSSSSKSSGGRKKAAPLNCENYNVCVNNTSKYKKDDIIKLARQCGITDTSGSRKVLCDRIAASVQSSKMSGAPQMAPHTYAGVPQMAPHTYTGVPQMAPHTYTGVPQMAPQGVPQMAPQGVPQMAPQGVPQMAPQGVPQAHQDIDCFTRNMNRNIQDLRKDARELGFVQGLGSKKAPIATLLCDLEETGKVSCDPPHTDCPGDLVCDINNQPGFCVKPSYADTKDTFVQQSINGRRVIGTKTAMNALNKRIKGGAPQAPRGVPQAPQGVPQAPQGVPQSPQDIDCFTRNMNRNIQDLRKDARELGFVQGLGTKKPPIATLLCDLEETGKVSCDPPHTDCPGDLVCDINNQPGFCVKPSYADTKDNLKQVLVGNKRVIGSAAAIKALAKRVGQTSLQPFVAPTSQPFVVPPQQPQMVPPSQPFVVPPSQPFVVPPSQPFVVPPSQPSFVAPSQPFVAPSSQPSFGVRPQQPQMAPSSQPSFGVRPQQPQMAPSSQPSFGVRPQQPQMAPSSQPSFGVRPQQPQMAPSSQPSFGVRPQQPQMAPSSQPFLSSSLLPHQLEQVKKYLTSKQCELDETYDSIVVLIQQRCMNLINGSDEITKAILSQLIAREEIDELKEEEENADNDCNISLLGLAKFLEVLRLQKPQTPPGDIPSPTLGGLPTGMGSVSGDSVMGVPVSSGDTVFGVPVSGGAHTYVDPVIGVPVSSGAHTYVDPVMSVPGSDGMGVSVSGEMDVEDILAAIQSGDHSVLESLSGSRREVLRCLGLLG